MLLLAAGGGGGGSVPGLPGAALEGVLPGTLLDPICGHTATVEMGGMAGDSGSTYNAAWPATSGSQYQGGNGCEFGAGGGGGYCGGGGGGTSPVNSIYLSQMIGTNAVVESISIYVGDRRRRRWRLFFHLYLDP